MCTAYGGNYQKHLADRIIPLFSVILNKLREVDSLDILHSMHDLCHTLVNHVTDI